MFEDENSQLCRLCLKSGDCPIDIFHPKITNGLLVWKIIKELIGIETSHNDGLPPTICEDCMRKLTDFKYFKKLCINSRIEFLICRLNDGLVVPTGVDESGPLREDLCSQGDVHAQGSWSNVGAEGIKSEEPDVFEEPPQVDVDSSISDGNCSDDEVYCSDAHSGESVGISEEALIGTGHQMSAGKQHHAVVPVASHSHLEERSLRSHSKIENYGPGDWLESTPCSTSGKQFGEECGEYTRRKEEVRRESKHGIGTRAGSISIGSSVGDEKSEGQDFMCDACGHVFRSKDLIERHVQVPCGTALVECGTCSTMFHTRNEYRMHRSLHCGGNVSYKVQGGVAVDVSGESDGKRQIKKRNPPTCHICNKEFSRRSVLTRHVKTVHLKEGNFSCEICGKAFSQRQHLKSHMRIHSGVKPYTCSQCQKGFTQSGTLRTHIQAVHQIQKPHACGECGKTFSEKQHLKRHVLLHTGERPHTCDICSRSFSQKHHLDLHLLIHTGSKPHACALCSKTFRHNHHLKRHMATHARNVPPK